MIQPLDASRDIARRTIGALGVLSILSLATPAAAQRAAAAPLRPRLAAGVDTNDARAYYAYGMQTVYEKPDEAVRGFYWASRIDPTSSAALYALQSATLLAMTASDLADYYDFSRKSRKPEYLAIDSLLFRAYTIDPFLYPNFEHTLVRRRIEAAVVAANPGINRAQLNDGILSYTNSARFRANSAYADGRLAEALKGFADDLKYTGWTKTERARIIGDIHATRARIFYVLGNLDSARAEMAAGVEAMRARDAKDVVILYQSKAVYEQSLGMIDEKRNRPDSAAKAYEEALQEDLSYYPAHLRLSQLQLAKGDTSSALTELDLAVQLEPTNPALRYAYAVALIRARRDADAAAQLMKAVTANPFYAPPHLLLARIADVEQDTEDAVGEYQRYVALAAKADPELAAAAARLTTLNSSMANSRSHQ